jgi:hypothetical protein
MLLLVAQILAATRREAIGGHISVG